MRRTTLAALVAVAAGAGGCGGSGLARETAAAPTAAGSVLAYVWDGKPLLVRADPVTLERRGPAVDLGKPPISTWVRSSAGDRLALGSGDGARLTFVDLRAMRRLGTLELGASGYVAALAWPSPRRVVAALSGTRVEILVVDPEARGVVARHGLPGVVTRAACSPDGLVLLISPRDRIGPAVLAVATVAGVRTAALPVPTGVDPPQVAEPGLAVSPDGRRAVVVQGGATRVVEVDLRTLEVMERELSEPVSLLGRLGSWLEPAALAKGPLDGPVRSAAWTAGDRMVLAGWNYRAKSDRSTSSDAAGVRLIDTRRWRVRTLTGKASAALIVDDTVLAFGGTQAPDGLHGVGVQGFDTEGRRRFHLFGNRFVDTVAVAGRYVYVAEQFETRTRIDVVDVAAGRVVRTIRTATYTDVLQFD